MSNLIFDIYTVVWKEWRELLFQRGSLRTTLMSLLPLLLVFSIFLPSQIGSLWVESPLTIGLWGWLPTLQVLALTADAFAGERERHTLETLLASPLSELAILLGKVITVVSYGWLMTLLVVLTGLIGVNFFDGNGILLYPASILFGGMVLGFLSATLAASIGVIVSLRSPTVRQAAQKLAFVSIALTWIPIIGFNLLPSLIQESLVNSAKGADITQVFYLILVVLALIDAGLLSIAMVRFKRSRLILD